MDLDTAVRFLTGFAPDFATTIAGATEARVVELESLVGRRLPASYRRFLELFGEDDAYLASEFGSDLSIGALIAHYESPTFNIPAPYLCIGLDDLGGDPQFQTCLVESEADDPAVVLQMLRQGSPTEVWPAAASLGELVFRYGFTALVGMTRGFDGRCRVLEPDRSRVQNVSSALEKLSLLRHPASEGYAQFFERDDLAVEVFYPPGAKELALSLYGDEERSLLMIAEVLEREAGAVTDWVKESDDAVSVPVEDGDEGEPANVTEEASTAPR